MLGLVAPVLGLFFGGWLLSTMLEPLVGRLVRHTGAQRSAAVFATYVVVLVTCALVWILASPVLAAQISASVSRFPVQVDTAARQVRDAQSVIKAWLTQHDVAIQLDLSPDNLARQVGSQFQSSASIPLTIVTGVMGALGSLALMLLLSVFFLVGGPQLAEQLAQLFRACALDAAAVVAGPSNGDAADGQVAAVSVAEAGRRLGIGRARVYQLIESGVLEALDAEPLRISLASIQRRLQGVPPAGAQLAPLSAWAVLALASGDGAFTRHVAGLLADPDRSRGALAAQAGWPARPAAATARVRRLPRVLRCGRAPGRRAG